MCSRTADIPRSSPSKWSWCSSRLQLLREWHNLDTVMSLSDPVLGAHRVAYRNSRGTRIWLRW